LPLFYLDASGVVKAYVDELGSDWIRSLISSEHVALSSIAIAEVAAALARRSSNGDLTDGEARRAFMKFLDDVRRFDVISASDAVLRRASAQSLRQDRPSPPLRALDSIHLATALQSSILLRQSADEQLVFVVADRRLREAASAAGLHVENPEDHA
jgi:predicted nucleic acid-binding protein